MAAFTGYSRVRQAGPGGVVPYETPNVRVGPARLPPIRRRPGAIPGPTIDTLPTGTYNPERRIQLEEGQRGLGELEGQGETAFTRNRADYAKALQELGTVRTQRQTDLQRNLDTLSRSYKLLGTRQEEGANKAGVLSGGALLQAAAKRAANQGRETSEQQATAQRGEADLTRKGELLEREQGLPAGVQSFAQLLSSGGVGAGRELQDLATKILGSRTTQTEQGRHLGDLAVQEAAEGGYEPTAAPVRRAPARPRRPVPRRRR